MPKTNTNNKPIPIATPMVRTYLYLTESTTKCLKRIQHHTGEKLGPLIERLLREHPDVKYTGLEELKLTWEPRPTNGRKGSQAR